MILGGIAGLFSPISSNIYVPAIPTLASAFGRTAQDISLGVTVYLVFQVSDGSPDSAIRRASRWALG